LGVAGLVAAGVFALGSMFSVIGRTVGAARRYSA
jgi:hypothetical protein